MDDIHQLISLAGGKTALARALGITPQAVDNWARRGRIPADHIPRIESLYGQNGMTAERLRPDIPWHLMRESAEKGAA